VTVTSRGARRAGSAAEPGIVTRHSLSDRQKRLVRILLAEDNLINQKVALKTLENMGYGADVVGSGVEAVRALGERRYDLVFMDVQMPEMDGLEATRQIRDPRSAVQDHDVPVVALTAHAMAGDRESCLAAGMSDYLSKPIQPDQLAAVLARWTGPSRAAEPTVESVGSASAAEPSGEDASVDRRPAAQLAAPLATSDGGHTPAAEEPVFDEGVLLRLLAGDHAAAAEIVAEFLADAPRQVEALHEALAGADVSLARRQAHTLKGASANVGAEALRAVAARMDRAARAGDLVAARSLEQAVDNELARLTDVLTVRAAS
jgi:CheY-like chemotaxis protein/HPt (histidine-containing phosphotransfer) domain-containing protein